MSLQAALSTAENVGSPAVGVTLRPYGLALAVASNSREPGDLASGVPN